MVLISVQSVEDNNGYQFKNDFSESIIIDPKSKISLVSILFERSADFVVQTTSNMFKVRVGAPNAPLDTISILPDTYTPNALAEAIQIALNNKYGATGHNWDVKYDSKKQEFIFTDTFQQSQIPIKVSDSYDQSEGNEPSITGTGTINWGGVTAGTSNYCISRDLLETTFTPPSIYGGSSVETLITFTTANYPPTPGGDTFGFLTGLTSGYLNPDAPEQQASPVASAANLTWLDCGIVYYKNPTGASFVKFIENGVSIGIDLAFVLRSGDILKVMLATDDPALPNFPTYWYKRVNDELFNKFSVQGGTQSLRYSNWDKLKLKPVVASDSSQDGTANNPYTTTSFTPKGVANIVPRVLQAGDSGDRLGAESTFTDGAIHRKLATVAGGSLAQQLVFKDNGVLITEKVGAEVYSELTFQLWDKDWVGATHDPIDAYVAIVDENQRRLNQGADGDADSNLGNDSCIYGNTAKNQADAYAIEDAGDLNPSLLAFRFKAQNVGVGPEPGIAGPGSEESRYPSNTIYYRDSFNTHNGFQSNSIVQPVWLPVPTGSFTWNPDTHKNALFCIKTFAASGKSELWASPSGSKSNADYVQVHTIRHNRIETTGLKTASINTAGADYTANITARFRTTSMGDASNYGIVDIATNAGGVPNGAVSVICGGALFANGVEFKLIEIDATTGIDITPATGSLATIDCDAVVDYNHTGNRGTTYDANKTFQGYSYYMGVGSYDVSRATPNIGQQGIHSIDLAVENAFNSKQEYAELHPRVEPAFGNLIGMSKSRYILDKQTNWSASSDAQPQPDGSVSTHPLLHIYADNLPVKSYVGKRFRQNATINDAPIGNQQGLTHLIAQVPRHHDDNGDNGSANTGPYYFDYFPYSIPLHNATQLLRNELDISIRNPDGTLATDITRSLLLLDVSNVDNVGEGLTGGSIGNPRDRGQNYAQRDIGKNQLEPAIRGGFSQSKGSGNEQPARHDHADTENTAISSGANKSATLF